MRFSRRTDYGLILLEELVPTFRSGEHRSLRAITDAQHLPHAFLAKIASALKRRGIITAEKGSRGGYRLIRDPQSITVQDIIRIFEEPAMMRCLHSPHPEQLCPLAPSCPTRQGWQRMDQAVEAVFAKTTIASLS